MHIEIERVTKAFNEYAAIDDISVRIPEGELVALLGPSGSGKTTLLRIIAGIEAPDRGRIRYGDVDVTDRPIQDRRVGFVFQDYALFDHMTIGDNIAFGLAVRKAPQRADRARACASCSRASSSTASTPATRASCPVASVSASRSRAPSPPTRSCCCSTSRSGRSTRGSAPSCRAWLRRLHDDLHLTSIFVTHDQEEALEVADRIVVMNHGTIEQVGAPSEVFDEPASAFVMDFLGSVNILQGSVSGAQGVFGELELAWEGRGDGPARAYVRSHDLVLQHEPTARTLPVVVERVHRVGVAARVLVATSQGELTAELPHHELAELGIARGARLYAHVRSARIFLREAVR